MKKIFFAAVLAAFALGAVTMTSCEKKCTEEYTLNYSVKNGTDREIIVVFYDYSGEEAGSVTIAPGKEELVAQDLFYGECNNTVLLEDLYPDDDDVLLPEVAYYNSFQNDHAFLMTVDGEEVAKKIWMRRNWTFKPGYYDWSYTLTVTDALLTGL